jgi:hypothetical protein
MKPAVVILAPVLAALQFVVADDLKTIDGKEYKNVTVKRVEPDGIVLSSKVGISKVYFTELSKDVQERFHYNPDALAADLLAQAESALRSGQFGQGAELLNRIVTEYPNSRQAQTVYHLRAILRGKQQTQSGPLTADEADTLGALMDNLAKMKKNYHSIPPQGRQVLESMYGVETFQNSGTGLSAVASSEAKFIESRHKALQGQ